MDFIQLSELIGIGGLIMWAFTERGFTLLHQQQKDGVRESAVSYWLISLFWYGTMIYAFLDIWNMGWTDFDSNLIILRGLGILLVGFGVTLRFISRRVLGKYYSAHVETSDQHQLVTDNIYGKVRHPAYLGLMCLFLGIPLSLGSWGAVGIAMLGGLPAMIYRIKIEEQSLLKWFGQEYAEYIQKTWKLIPYIW